MKHRTFDTCSLGPSRLGKEASLKVGSRLLATVSSFPLGDPMLFGSTPHSTPPGAPAQHSPAKISPSARRWRALFGLFSPGWALQLMLCKGCGYPLRLKGSRQRDLKLMDPNCCFFKPNRTAKLPLPSTTRAHQLGKHFENCSQLNWGQAW